MLTEEECLKALCRIQCGAKRNKKCEDCKCFDTKINPWKCVENTNESLIIRDLVEEHFNPQPLKFEELHENMWVYDVKNKCCIYIEEFTVNNQMMIIRYPMSNRDSNCEWCNFEENRFYPIQIPKAEGEK
jgi:hypothetical protein|nr:MAG TPA: hypothetical protein [Caudoviricetes sp.]